MTAVIVTTIICVTVIVLALIGRRKEIPGPPGPAGPMGGTGAPCRCGTTRLPSSDMSDADRVRRIA